MPNIAVPPEHEANPIGYAMAALAPERTQAFFAFSTLVYQRSILPLRVFEGVRARIAQINGCQICRAFRGAEDIAVYLEGMGEDPRVGVHANGPAPDEAFYADLEQWRTSPAYSDDERLAIEYAERFSLAPDALGRDAGFWAELRAAFSEAEIYDMTLAAAAFVAGGRMVHALGFDEGAICALKAPVAAE